MKDDELIRVIEFVKNTMISVATGGGRIQDANDKFRREFVRLDTELRRRALINPIPYSDLWEWHGRWSTGDLPTYQSRRNFLAEMVKPLLAQIAGAASGKTYSALEPTGWVRVDRTVGEMRTSLARAQTPEQYQAVGLLCREALISLAQAVYDRDRHGAAQGITPSGTDVARMLEAFVAVELAGAPNEEVRGHAKSALRLAVALQHRRTANLTEAAMCVEGTTAVINVVAIISGRRDP